MRIPFRQTLGLACLLVIPCLTLGVNGCMTDDESRGTMDTTKNIDPFPKPQGPKIIPLDQESFSAFHYVEQDSAGLVIKRIPSLLLYIKKRRDDIYTYAFENPSRGYLVRYHAASNPDSAGVYIVGTYQDSLEAIDAVPTLWLPQNPKLGVSWPIGSGRSMELVDAQKGYYTETLFPSDTVGAPVAQGFQRHTAYLFRETAGDTVTYYHFRKGVGCLGFERAAGGQKIASGTLKSFYRLTGRPF